MYKFIKPLYIVAILAGIASCNKSNNDSFAYGNFESDDLLVPAETSGILKEFYVEEGDILEKGESIGLIDTVQLNLKLRQTIASRMAVVARLSQINSQIEVQEVNLKNLEREYKRFGTLFLEEAATKKQMDDLEGQVEMVKAQINSLNSQKSSIYAEINAKDAQAEQIRDQIERSRILSPETGMVLETFANQGEMAVTGKPLLKMADLSQLILRVFIDGNQLSSIKLGEKVRVLYDGPQEIQETEGSISWISSEAEFTPKIIQTREDRINLVYAVKVKVPNDGSLKIGMPGEIKLIQN